MTPDQMRRMRMRRMNLLMAYASFAASRAAASTALFGDGTAGGTLLGATETDGLAVDFTAATPDLLIRDAASTLNYSGTPFLNDGGKLTFSRTSLATVVDDDGLIKWAPHNILVQSADFTTTWANSNTTDAANTDTAPDGTATADTIAASGANGTILQTWTAVAAPYTFAVWLRRKTGTGDIEIAADSGTWTAKAITADWALYTVAQTPAAGSKTAGIRIVTSGDEVYAWGAHLYRSDLGGMQDNGTAFPTYNPTVAAAYYGPRIDHDPVTLAKRGLLMEEARTNVALHNSDLTQAAWVASNITPLKNVTGPDGVANSASRITATAANGTILQTVTLASSARFQSAYVKRITGTGTVEMTTDNGSTWTAITVTADWTRVSIPSQTVTNPVFGFRIVTDTDAIAVFGVQNENGAFPTSYIPTTTASVTRALDACSIATNLFPYSATAGAVAVQIGNLQSFSFPIPFVIADSAAQTTKRIQLFMTGTSVTGRITDGSEVMAVTQTSALTIPGQNRIALAWQADDAAFIVNGGAANTDSSLTVPTVNTMYVGFGGPAAGQPLNGHLRQLTYIARRITNAELVERTS
jgi:hypothetical protein